MKGVRLFVVLLVVSAKCRAMTNTELEDFKDFLDKTSALDHTLKDGFTHNEDEDELVSDHAWEESGKFEGDLILSDRQRHLIVEDVAEGLSRNGLNDITKRWPNNEVIYYIQKEHFSGTQIQAIQDGIDDIGQSSCISFRPYKKGDRDAVVIQGSRRGCFSQVGYQGGYQVLNLSGRHPVGRGCFRHGTVVHEMLHTLGFYHMQSSPDRDDYINVVWENIVERAKHNFRKYNSFAVTDFGVGYDYDSVLHYSKRAFSNNGKPTLVPKQDSVRIGQRVGMSEKDKEKLNKMYCDNDNNNFEAADSIDALKNKQTVKTKPFQGHGIGYHQGKAVVIKLPTADTYSLPDLPSYHIYDYFSKMPKTLTTTFPAGFGSDTNTYRIPNAKDFGSFIYKSPPIAKENKKKKEDVEFISPKPEQKINNQPKTEIIEQTKTLAENNTNNDDGVLDAALEDAFDRLRKIIKVHVYPTRGVDVKPYKENNESLSNTESYYEELNNLKHKLSQKDEKSDDKINRDSSSFEQDESSDHEKDKTGSKEEISTQKNSKDYPDFGDSMEKRVATVLKAYGDIEDIRISPNEPDYSDYEKPTIYEKSRLSNHRRDYDDANHRYSQKLRDDYDPHEPYKYTAYYKPKKWVYN